MNTEHREVLLDAFRRFQPRRSARAWRAATRRVTQVRSSVALPLAVVAVFVLGLGLIEFGLWPMYKPAAIGIGVLIAVGTPRVFVAIWRSR